VAAMACSRKALDARRLASVARLQCMSGYGSGFILGSYVIEFVQSHRARSTSAEFHAPHVLCELLCTNGFVTNSWENSTVFRVVKSNSFDFLGFP
jgi:hypothetical protein